MYSNFYELKPLAVSKLLRLGKNEAEEEVTKPKLSTHNQVIAASRTPSLMSRLKISDKTNAPASCD